MTPLGASHTERPVKGVIICADDFAVNQSTSLGITKLARMGRISATSVMVLSARWPGDARLLIELRSHMDVGLHLDWTSTFAMAAGHGMPLGQAMLRALVGGFDRKQAEAVIERQLDLFEIRWQSPPNYVDGHQHVQQFAGIREALVDVLARRYGAQAPYLRISRAPAGTGDLKAWMIAKMGASALENIAASAGLKRAGALLGIYNLADNTLHYATLMAGWLAQAPAGSIIMCHPAQASEPGDEIGLARAQEFAYLAGPDYAQALNQAGVMPVRGSTCDALAGPTKISQ